MLVPRFKIRRTLKGWVAESDFRRAGRYRGFTAVGRRLSDLKRWVAIVRMAERSGKLEQLGWLVQTLERETGIQSTWGGNWFPPRNPVGRPAPQAVL